MRSTVECLEMIARFCFFLFIHNPIICPLYSCLSCSLCYYQFSIKIRQLPGNPVPIIRSRKYLFSRGFFHLHAQLKSSKFFVLPSTRKILEFLHSNSRVADCRLSPLIIPPGTIIRSSDQGIDHIFSCKNVTSRNASSRLYLQRLQKSKSGNRIRTSADLLLPQTSLKLEVKTFPSEWRES